mgnify:FL=1
MDILLILISLIICILILNYKIIDSIQYDNFPYEKLTKEAEEENRGVRLYDRYEIHGK